ncbi:VOC family protein [Ancylobacter pratisalsi]|uniref:VOC family protein n=1 Tax=Ancylobacter pratisalsi TaxID=1745854 RepID=A0A6P1YIN3_9HYPH|nr:VOC family protein [Ancylobacter pratisalsi]QIB32992.1 VOC family protein [Ancylobacter pratisalsi]
MFSHVYVGVSDFDRALAFYQPLMRALGLELKFCDWERGWAGWKRPDADRPLFLIGYPFEAAHHPGNGQMSAFEVETRALVDHWHALALERGGSDEGAPAVRAHYHANYYGAYVRDLDGNKLCVCCHSEQG